MQATQLNCSFYFFFQITPHFNKLSSVAPIKASVCGISAGFKLVPLRKQIPLRTEAHYLLDISGREQ